MNVGAIFEGSDGQLESIFRQTVDRINLDKSRMSKPRLEAQVARINHRDSFHAAKLGQFISQVDSMFTCESEAHLLILLLLQPVS